MEASIAHLDVVVCVQCEPMVDALWQHDHVALVALYSNPPVVLVSNVEVACVYVMMKFAMSYKILL
jgi:hypothetical protein